MPFQPLSPTAKKNVETIAQVEQQLVGRRTRRERIGEAIARFFGTLRFIFAHAVLFNLHVEAVARRSGRSALATTGNMKSGARIAVDADHFWALDHFERGRGRPANVAAPGAIQ